ncbi:MAG: Xaa-Pro peptidase family protein [Candidatus Micrarchaeales archaeon]|jgi:Xaa-Pro dipeptidase|uniref:Peptidase M24 n=1 Tax=Candidatus Micrarchaeum acidiphilum ARMAN-2 TaxID=425595 RepID=C7DG78_MICA2|nr:MAG: peptidase M24 [Candidatus Micrarchaeum acidiphilum ARMAN-2]MCW6161185.1 Xaa-Pro peptidase family protein [Candidatus Micrarchaeales archaeon]
MADIKMRLQRLFAGSAFDSAVIVNSSNKDPNFLYFTDIEGGIFENDILVLSRNRATLITSALEYGIASASARPGLEVLMADTAEKNRRELKSLLEGKTVGFNSSFMPFGYYSFIKKYGAPKRMVDAAARLGETREIKDDEEIGRIRRAIQITKKSLDQIQDYFEYGIKETQLAARFDYLMGENGAQGKAFDSIVSFGKNSALPHHMPDNTRLKPNEYVLLDVGAKYRNYCADITRTFVFKPDKKSARYKRMERIYDTVKRAQDIGFRILKDGADGSSAQRAVEDYIDHAAHGAYKGMFIHSLGHQIGIEVHDGIGMSRAQKILRSGMVVSDEPGIYVKGFGGVRIEDDVLITKSGAKML